MLRSSLITLVLACFVLPAHAGDKVERRCGWFENQSPANATLTDRDGTWEIAAQGGYQAKGDWPPHFSDAQWVPTNGHYGYGCGCITASVDPESHRLNNLTKATARPLAACRDDATLHEPANPLASTPPATGSVKDMKSYQAEGFSFSYPKGWKVSKDKKCLRLNEPKIRANEEYTLKLCAQHGTLEQAADSMFFSLKDGVWMRNAGMDSPSPVDLIEGPGWKGMQTTQTCGVSDKETGFHAAGGTCLMAIVYNAKTQLLFDTVGYYQDFGTTDAIIQSVQFDEKK
jgi:hypothetical protein